MKTSEDVREMGLYESSCCQVELTFAKGDCFSRCPRCSRLCSWELVDNLTSSEVTGQPLEGQAA